MSAGTDLRYVLVLPHRLNTSSDFASGLSLLVPRHLVCILLSTAVYFSLLRASSANRGAGSGRPLSLSKKSRIKVACGLWVTWIMPIITVNPAHKAPPPHHVICPQSLPTRPTSHIVSGMRHAPVVVDGGPVLQE